MTITDLRALNAGKRKGEQMPVYEYRCGECGAREEHTHSIHQTYTPRCEKCGRWMRLLYTPAASVFVGDGWAKKERKKGEGK